MTNGRGPTGQFANLGVKYKNEIPMAVLLPTGGPVRKTISGTDIDGVREVDGIIAVHEYKKMNAPAPSDGQVRAMKQLGDFFIGSRWIYEKAIFDGRTLLPEERLAKENNYRYKATPISARIYCKTDDAKKWLFRYLTDCCFPYIKQRTDDGLFVLFDSDNKLNTHVFQPTDEWRNIAYIPDYYADYSLRNKYHHPLPF